MRSRSKSSQYFRKQRSQPRHMRRSKKPAKAPFAWKLRGIILGTCIIISGIIIGRYHARGHPRYRITSVSFDQSSLTVYDNPELLAALVDVFSGAHTTATQRGRTTHPQSVSSQFPYVDRIARSFTNPQSIEISINFVRPDFVRRSHDGQERAVISQSHTTFPIQDIHTIDDNILRIHLPDYARVDHESIHSIRYATPAPVLTTIFHTLNDFFPHSTLTYLAGSSKVIVTQDDGPTVYISTSKDLMSQLDTYRRISSMETSVGNAQTIDISSLEHVIVGQ